MRAPRPGEGYERVARNVASCGIGRAHDQAEPHADPDHRGRVERDQAVARERACTIRVDSRKPWLTREQLAASAHKIADEEGFDALSMRRIVDDVVFGSVLHDPDDGRDNLLDAACEGDRRADEGISRSGRVAAPRRWLAGREPIDAFIAMSTDVTEHRRSERGLAPILDGFVAKCD